MTPHNSTKPPKASAESGRMRKASRVEATGGCDLGEVFESATIWNGGRRDASAGRETHPFAGAHEAEFPTEPPASQERRRAQRLRFEVLVQLRRGADTVTCSSEDLSARGIFLRTPWLLEAGAIVALSFPLPCGLMEVDAVAIHSRAPHEDVEAGIGFRFSGLTAIQEAYLTAFCDARVDRYS
ncbi:MAG: PilZ domain-containing protein [Myxococcales bacterium]|nr:PilZ domain-containing protein [Myxococcales bacterium]